MSRVAFFTFCLGICFASGLDFATAEAASIHEQPSAVTFSRAQSREKYFQPNSQKFRDLWIQKSVLQNYSFDRVKNFSVHRLEDVTIYLHSNLSTSVSQEKIFNLLERLTQASQTSVYPELGYVPLIRNFFGPFPSKFSKESTLDVVLLDTKENEWRSSSPFLLPQDQMSEEMAEKIGTKSNQGNFLYVPVLTDQDEELLASIIKILPQFSILDGTTNAYAAGNWLHFALSEAALFLSGFFLNDLSKFAASTHLFSLTQENSSPKENPLHTLFASFLLDTVSNKQMALTFLSKNASQGKLAVETLFRSESSRPVTFDVIFGNFVSYLFSSEGLSLPISISRPDIYEGIPLPPLQSYLDLAVYPYRMEAAVFPYGFLAVNLKSPIPAGAVVQIQNVSENGPGNSCAKGASVLWKPINPKKIAIYSVGCNPLSNKDSVKFRLNIFDKPSIFPASPLKILAR